MASSSLIAANKDRAEQYLKAIENHSDGHIENLEEFVADDVINHTSLSGKDLTPQEDHGIEAFRRHAEAVPRAFPDVHFDIEDVIAEDDRVMVRLVLTGTHDGPFLGLEPTGKEIAMSAIVVYRYEDGKIVERWSEGNTVGLLEQLGALPA